MSRKTTSRILEVLKQQPNEISGTELANKTSIDIKNLSKYTKELVESHEITERTDQNGKIRTKYYTINRNTTDRPTPIVMTRKKEEITSRKNSTTRPTMPEPKPEPEPVRIPAPNHTSQEKLYVCEFNDMLAFCKLSGNTTDIECLQFLRDNDPEITRTRGGGCHSGATKHALAILRKMARVEGQKQ